MKPFFLYTGLFLLLTTTAQAADMSVLTSKLTQGQTLVATLTQKPSNVSFDDKPVAAFPYQTGWRVIVPLPLSTRIGSHTLTATIDGKTVSKAVTVGPRRATVINLPVPPKLNQTPQQLVKNLATTNTGVATAVQVVTQTTRFTQPFGLPLADNRKISSPFGEIRQTRSANSGQAGEERITHLGTDFDVKKGTKIGAINAGVVSSAYVDPVYGNSIIVDHGRGIYSLYLHLDTMRVKTGDTVKKGTFIGTVGDSGLASGPHLHLSIKINGQSVDPIQFVSAFQ